MGVVGGLSIGPQERAGEIAGQRAIDLGDREIEAAETGEQAVDQQERGDPEQRHALEPPGAAHAFAPVFLCKSHACLHNT